jgi:hypothetical protein
VKGSVSRGICNLHIYNYFRDYDPEVGRYVESDPKDNRLSVAGTDLEVELVGASNVTVQQAGDMTIPGRKLLDIFALLCGWPRGADQHIIIAGRFSVTGRCARHCSPL